MDGGSKRKYDDVMEVTMPKIVDGCQNARGKDGPKVGMLRNYCKSMEITMEKIGVGTGESKANDGARCQSYQS